MLFVIKGSEMFFSQMFVSVDCNNIPYAVHPGNEVIAIKRKSHPTLFSTFQFRLQHYHEIFEISLTF